MTMIDDSVELQTVKRYLDEHFNPIRRLLGARIPDPYVRKVALRRCTRHIFHWRQDAIDDPAGPDHADSGEPVKPGNGASQNGSQDCHNSGEAPGPDERPPEEWATGGEQATERQVAVLEDHGVAIPAECTKARRSSSPETDHLRRSRDEPPGFKSRLRQSC